jgi:hypothetical protein
MPDIDGVAEESDWEMLDQEAADLGARLARWTDQVRDEVRANRPPLPALVRGRAKERWMPLKRVAAAAGGHWPELVDQLSVMDVQRLEAEREEGIVQERPALILIRHIVEVWEDGENFVHTEELIDRLAAGHPDMWGERSAFGKRLTPQRLGRMLVTSYNIHSDRPDPHGKRGYRGSTLAPVMRRFGMTLSCEPDQTAEPDAPMQHRCTDCGGVLDPAVMVGGFTTHPCCATAA